MEKPKLRIVEAFPAGEHAGRALIGLRDPLKISEKMVCLAPETLEILRFFDGRHTLSDIQEFFLKHHAVLLETAVLRRIVSTLDEAHLLDSPAFREYQEALIRDFTREPRQTAHLPGQSYPSRPEEIKSFLRGHFDGKLPPKDALPPGPAPAGLVLPHIDLRVGGAVYASGLQTLVCAQPPELFVILGTGHSLAARFSATGKDWQTPLGTIPADPDFFKALAGRLPFDLYTEPLAHRCEHSLEFQILYLQYLGRLFPDLGKAKVVPILVGSYHDLLSTDEKMPMDDPAIRAFARALRETIAGCGRRVCLIGSVDLAHMGGRFGHRRKMNERARRELEEEDRRMLARALARDPDGFFRFGQAEKDCRNVDGYPIIHLMLEVLKPDRVELIRYEQNYEPDTDSVVSYASLRMDKTSSST